jgi:hypothetical protein
MSEKTAKQLLAQYREAVRKKAERERAIAKSKTAEAEKKREAQRAKKAKKLAESLTKNLPDADDINPNQGYSALRMIVAKAAFTSALENGVLFIDKGEHTLYVTKGEETVKVMASDLVDQAAALVEWSEIGPRLTDDKGKRYNQFSLYYGLLHMGRENRLKEAKKKSSEAHFNELIEAMASVKLDTTKKGSHSDEAVNEIIEKTAATAKKLGKEFRRDQVGNLYLFCSEKERGIEKLDKKDILPFFKRIMNQSQLAGKFKSTADPDRFVAGFAAKQPKLKNPNFREKEYRIVL